ncbi:MULTISPECIES: flagellar hook-associated protein FlgK [unclassified Yoonia]|uniref:flagellar hook-associated protein FlgK n=1 Tax=unclassified Yoonia TaxID=2629118 RepID=UPI002AFE0119|nr:MULTISPECIES: flagellar hook-associated protein FlgK [unclassified Yoonia]
MSISSALNNAVTGLTASSRLAEVVSSNLSNALTEGYGRRDVTLSAAQVGGKGGGVRIEGITRFSDPGLLADRRLADAALTAAQRSANALVRLETSFGGVDGSTGLAARYAAFEQALISASSDPASPTRLTAAVSRLSDVAMTLQAQTRSTQSLRQEADAAIKNDIERLNRGLQQVADLNKDVLRIKAAGNDPSGLLDARQQIIDDIATILPVREVMRDNGTVGLMTTNGTTLLDGRPVQFGFEPTPTITADMTLASGALSGVTLDNQPLDPLTGIGRLGGGSLGAAFITRDVTLVETQQGLDHIAADLISRFQDPNLDPTIVAGLPGILTDEAGPLDLADLVGLAGRIAVAASIDPARGGDPSLLRDGLYATLPGPSGDSAQLDRWLSALVSPRSDVPGASVRSVAGRIADFAADIGTRRLTAEEAVSFSAARWDNLRVAELANGVDTDFELQVLLRVEQAYAANARVIETVNLMMQRLMEI